jgi:hypothetical protein
VNEKCCGTCRWWEPREDHETRGECMWHFSHPLPDAVSYNQSYMQASEGIGCRCWELRT